MDKRQAVFPYRWWSVLGIVLLLFTAVCAQWVKGEWGDKFWLLETAKLWLSGKHFYHDIFQPNLPMIFWLYSLPVWLSQHTGLENQHWLVLLTLALVGISVWVCHRLMRHHPYFAAHPDMQVRHIVLLLFTFIVFANVAHFADREHLMMVLMFPFLLRHMPSLAQRPMSLRLRLMVACMAAIGPCIKPHALLLLGGVYLIRMIRERSLRVLFTGETLCSVGVIGAYLALLCLTTEGYFTIVLPMLTTTYFVIRYGVGSYMFYLTSAFMLAVTLSDFRLRYTSPLRRDILYLLALCALGLGHALINNGWPYTFYPLYSLLLLLTGWVYWEFGWLKEDSVRQEKDPIPFRQGALACWVNMAVNLLYIIILHGGYVYYAWFAVAQESDPGDGNLIAMERLIKEEHIHSIGAIDINFGNWAWETRKTGVSMETRFNCLFMLPIFFKRDEMFARKYDWIPRYVADAYAEDLSRNKPEMMLVEFNNDFRGTGKKVNLVEYLSQYASFAEAWKHYSLFKTLDICNDVRLKNVQGSEQRCRIELYRRMVHE